MPRLLPDLPHPTETGTLLGLGADESGVLDIGRRSAADDKHSHKASDATDRRLRGLCVLAALCAFGLLSTLVFVPWKPEPFDTLDFSEFLLVLHETSSFWTRLSGLAAYYATHGRVSQVAYGLIAANYSLFGLEPLGWQITRCLPMLFLPPATYLVLRRLGSGRLASLIGASLYVVGTVPAAGWLRLTGEPIGTLFLLGSTALAHGWSDSPRGNWRTAVLAFCVLGMLFSKETMVACLPFLVAVATFWSRDNEMRRPHAASAAGRFLLTCIAACLVLGAALVWAATSRQGDAYAGLYGASVLSPRVVASRVAQLTLPVSYYTDLWRILVFPPNLVFTACLTAGLIQLARAGRRRLTSIYKLLIAASLPFAGVLVYVPWPRFEPFHAIPFLLGLAIVVAVLVDATAIGPRARVLVVVCWLFVLAASAVNATGLAQFSRARRQLNHEMARQIAAYDSGDTLLVATANLTPHEWQNPAATIERYTRAVGLTEDPPVLLDIECRSGTGQQWQEERARYVTFVFEAHCGSVRNATRRMERTFMFFDWTRGTFQPVIDRVAVIEPKN